MRAIWPLSVCHTIGWIILALIFSVLITFILATVMVVIVEYPKGYTSLFAYISKENGIGDMIASVAIIFSGCFVIVGVFATISDQQNRAEKDRIGKLKATRSTLPSVYHELSKICMKLTQVTVNKEKSISKHDIELSKSSIDTIKQALELLKGNECEELFKVLTYYQIAIFKFEGMLLKRIYWKDKDLNRKEKELIIDLVSLKSIAETYARSALHGSNAFCMTLCRNQFRHNMHLYNKNPGQIGDSIEKIGKDFGLNLLPNSEFGGYVGFLNEDYFKRYDL